MLWTTRGHRVDRWLLLPEDGGTRAGFIGDSVMLGAKRDIISTLQPPWQVSVDAKVSRPTPDGLAIIEADPSAYADVAVIQLGTNDGGIPDVYEQHVAEIADALEERPADVADDRRGAQRLRGRQRCGAPRAGASQRDRRRPEPRYPRDDVSSDGLHLGPTAAAAMGHLVASLVTPWRLAVAGQARTPAVRRSTPPRRRKPRVCSPRCEHAGRSRWSAVTPGARSATSLRASIPWGSECSCGGLWGREPVSAPHLPDVPTRSPNTTSNLLSAVRKPHVLRTLSGDDKRVGTAVVVTLLVLLAVGMVVDQLLRLRKWLNRPPSREDPEPPAWADPSSRPATRGDLGWRVEHVSSSVAVSRSTRSSSICWLPGCPPCSRIDQRTAASSLGSASIVAKVRIVTA